MTGPLDGLRIIELAGIGPAPFAAMMLADHGAEIIRIERPGRLKLPDDPVERGRTVLPLDLRNQAHRELLLDLVENADALIDPYRPGRIEALGIGADVLQQRNPRLVIGRLSGYGQHGPLSQKAGHDINYLAISGLLDAFGTRKGRPLPPANLVADYGGGAMMLLFGMLAALWEVRGGAERGRVVDAAMVEGSALLGTMLAGMRAAGLWRDGRERNMLDGGMALYNTYKCSDGRYLAVGAIEPAFARAFLLPLDLADSSLFGDPLDRDAWADQREIIADRIAAHPLAHWLDVYEGKDACVSPVLSPREAAGHRQAQARKAFVGAGERLIPAPAPRYAADPLEAPPLYRSQVPRARAFLEAEGVDDALIEDILKS